MANEMIKEYAKANKVYLWKVAKALNISVDTFVRRLRDEFSKEESDHIIKIIDELRKKGA